MMNVSIGKLVKRGIRVAGIMATFSLSMFVLNATANADAPALYNANPGTDQSKLKDNSQMTHKIWVSFNGLNSDYGMQSDLQPVFKTQTIINMADFNKNPNLVEHFQLKNDGPTANIHQYVGLPLLNQAYPGGINGQFVYSGSLPVVAEAGSQQSGITISPSMSGTSNPENLQAFMLDGSFGHGNSLSFSLPLKLKDGATIDTTNDVNLLKPQQWSYNPSDSMYNLGIRFAYPTTISTNATDKQYLATIKNSDGSYAQAKDIQNLMPKINTNSELSIADFGQDVHSSAANDTYLYTCGKYSVNPSKMNGFIDMLHNNGYAIPAGMNPYDFDASDAVDSSVSSLLNKGNIGGINLQLLKIIDANDSTISTGRNFDPLKGVTLYNPDQASQTNKLASSNLSVSSNVDANKPGTYTVTYTYKDANNVTYKKTVKVTVTGNPITPNHGSNVNPVPVNPTGSTNPNWNPSKPGDLNGTGLPNYAAVKGSAVYSTKGIYMYKNANFKRSQRMAYYPKVKRVNRHMFVVLGYDRSNGGALRYKVRDVNHGKKTAGKVGYITANRKYVVNVYYKGMPKSNKITVISKKGVHSYTNKNLTGRTGTYKKGTHLRVKDIVKHNLTTRYQLTNGDYVTANKKLVIQGTY